MPYSTIGELAGISPSETTIRQAFEAEGYHRRIARIRPWLSAQAKQRRLDWCLAHPDWLVPDWLGVIWTDEAAFRVGDVFGDTWVTRRPNEEFNLDCQI